MTEEPKIKAELDPTGVVQFTIPKEIMDRNEPEISYSTFRDVDNGDVIYQLTLHLEPKEEETDGV